MDFWDLTIRFFSLVDSNVRTVVAGSVLLGGAAGGLGSFVYLQKRSLLGDVLAHAALPGVAAAFLLMGHKDFGVLLAGAALSGWLGALTINAIARFTRIKVDTAQGIVLTFFFGLGIVLLTVIQKSGAGAQSGLSSFLFGQAAAMSHEDVLVLTGVALAMFLLVTAAFRQFTIISFDPGFAGSLGLPVGFLQFGLTTMIVLAVVIGLQAVGVVLMAAMLITPAAAARQWTDRFPRMIVLSSVFGILAGLLGTWISFLAPKFPTGPWMVVVVTALFVLSVLFAPERGLLSQLRRHRNNRLRMARDHVLKALYKAGSEHQDWTVPRSRADIAGRHTFEGRELVRSLRALQSEKLIARSEQQFALTPAGVAEGARIIRLHRLWEVYLSRYLELPGDHLHRDAEDMEHIITPEMEAVLEAQLEHPTHDPHRQEIPYPAPRGSS